jgi:hypothetical protein
MKRVVVALTACLLLGGLAMARLTQPACGCTRFGHIGVRDLVHAFPGTSVGLISVTAVDRENRSNPTTGDTETSIRVAATNWVGTIPTTLWINDRDLSSSGLSLGAFQPGTRWVVRVQNADAAISSFPLPVVGDSVRIPWEYINADPKDAKPEVVNLDELRGMARRQPTGPRARPAPATRPR